MSGPGAGVSRAVTRDGPAPPRRSAPILGVLPAAGGWTPPRVERTSLYLHVPFCRDPCPYCPYTKVPYRDELVGR